MKKLYTIVLLSFLATATKAATLCIPSFYSSTASCSAYHMNISLFAINGSSGTIIDTAGCDGSGYLNQTALSCTLAPGGSYTATIGTGSTAYTMNSQTWIDFNDDSTFQSTESVGGINTYSGSAAATYTISLPTTAAAGSHLMRVLATYAGGGIYYPSINPCSGYYYGEGRDYRVTIGSGSGGCTGTPTGGTSTTTPYAVCGTHGLMLSNTGYTTGSGISLQWQSSPTGSSSWTNISGATSSIEYLASPAATTYYQCVVTCSGSGMSASSSSSSISLDRIAGHIDYSATAPDTLSLKVWLIYHNTSAGTLTAIDSVVTCLDSLNPYYEFNTMGTGNYLVKAQSLDYTSSTPGASGFVPTYGTSNAHWSGGTTVAHTAGNVDSLHITMVYGTVTAGPGFIGGYISSGAGKNTATDVPAANMLVYLKNTTSGVITFVYTDASGNYSFTSLANGSYVIYPEALDYTTTPSATLTLAAGHESITGINFKQYNNSKTIKPVATAIHNVQANAQFNVYPNPAHDALTITWDAQYRSNADIIITDVTGRTAYNQTVDLSTFPGTTVIDTKAFASGIYFVKVKSDNINYFEKLLIQH